MSEVTDTESKLTGKRRPSEPESLGYAKSPADAPDLPLRIKSSTEKEELSLQRQKQITEYKQKVLREERKLRFLKRNNEFSDDEYTRSPSSLPKKKKVSFHVTPVQPDLKSFTSQNSIPTVPSSKVTSDDLSPNLS